MRLPRLLGWILGLTLAASAQSPPDVFLITLDTLRADRVGAYGYRGARTPALDRLAKDGILFRQAFTPSPITNSSHASILTGLNPSFHGVTDFGVPLGSGKQTWAEFLKERGYSTGAFIGAVILDSKTLAPGFNQGFDLYFDFPEKPPASRWGRVERRAADVAAEARKWLLSNRTAPRFVWIHFYDPHDPYEAPAPFGEKYRNQPYDGEVAYTDSVLAQFLGLLDKQGAYDNALIIAVGDHGEGLGEHKEDTHGIFLYDSTLRVPMIVKLPGRRQAGKVVETAVRTTDLLPTVLDLLGIRSKAEFQGASLRPLWEGNDSAERPLLAETDYPQRFGWAPLRAIRTSQHKFMEAPRPELYDLGADPGENRNLYEPWAAIVQELREKLAKFHAAAPKPQQPAAGAVGEKTIEHLRALGYLPETPGQTNVPEPSLLPDPKDKIELHNLIHRAMMADEAGRPAEARAALSKAVEVDSGSAVALYQLGQVEFKLGNYEAAARYLARARVLRPDASAALYHGRALEKLGQLAPAAEALDESLRLVPGQYEVRLQLGRIYQRLNKTEAALDQFEAAVFLEPKRAEARTQLGRALLDAKRFADAVERLEEAARLAPRDAEIHQLLAQAYEGDGKKQQARRAAARAAALKNAAEKKKAP